MSLNLIFLLMGAAFLASASVALRGSASVSVRSISAAGLATGGLMFLVGVVNALSGTM